MFVAQVAPPEGAFLFLGDRMRRTFLLAVRLDISVSFVYYQTKRAEIQRVMGVPYLVKTMYRAQRTDRTPYIPICAGQRRGRAHRMFFDHPPLVLPQRGDTSAERAEL